MHMVLAILWRRRIKAVHLSQNFRGLGYWIGMVNEIYYQINSSQINTKWTSTAEADLLIEILIEQFHWRVAGPRRMAVWWRRVSTEGWWGEMGRPRPNGGLTHHTGQRQSLHINMEGPTPSGLPKVPPPPLFPILASEDLIILVTSQLDHILSGCQPHSWGLLIFDRHHPPTVLWVAVHFRSVHMLREPLLLLPVCTVSASNNVCSLLNWYFHSILSRRQCCGCGFNAYSRPAFQLAATNHFSSCCILGSD